MERKAIDFQELASNRLVLRNLRMEDTQFMMDTINDPKVNKYLASSGCMSFVEEQAWLAKTITSNSKPTRNLVWVIDIDGKPAGVISLNDKKENEFQFSLGYFLAQEYWRQGIMTEAVSLVRDFAFRSELNIRSLIIPVLAPNEGSRKVALKSNFIEDGVLRRYYQKGNDIYDYVVHSLLRSEWEDHTK